MQSGQWYISATVDTIIPAGSYDSKRLVNLGRNYRTFQPYLAVSTVGKKRGPEFSIKLMYDLTTQNHETRYHTGEEFHTDFAVGYNIQPFTIGINGYYAKQVTDDKQNGVRVGEDGNQSTMFALGPTVRYQAGKIPITFQWQHELHVENRPQGNKFLLRAAFRL